ncbi:MAG: RHS repeat-associated core domain-containing protein, partial [Ignavibacteria bacterium]|nr:RHS repeat-associated core domain-containing protein [Ignavibacteria bacterium]
LKNNDFLDFAFCGGVFDSETGLTRFGARDYDASVGRWTAKDPIGFGGGQSNFYEYCLNDPVNNVDLNGLLDVRLNGEKWRLYKSKEHGSTHFHNIRTGEKYFPESNKVYNPNNKNFSSAGNKFVKQFSKALKNTKGLRSVTGAIGSGFWELYDLLIDALKKGKDPCNKNSFLDNFQDAYDSYINTPTFFENIFNNQNGIYSNNLPEV